MRSAYNEVKIKYSLSKNLLLIKKWGRRGKAPQAYTAFHGERGFRQGCRNKDTLSFAGRKAIRVS